MIKKKKLNIVLKDKSVNNICEITNDNILNDLYHTPAKSTRLSKKRQLNNNNNNNDILKKKKKKKRKKKIEYHHQNILILNKILLITMKLILMIN